MDEIDSPPPPGGCPPAHWYDTWDRQVSQSFSSAAKGLRNAPGENNCFLNSAVQVFWHIDVFRRSYRRLSGHLCMGNSCIFCALKVIFTQFQYSDQTSLQPSALRKALANTFAKQERFQLGHMDDAAECFENILRRIHFHIANTYNEDTCNAPHCVSHQKFAMTVFDQLVCPCGASSDPLTFHEIVHYISANALVSQSRSMQETGDILHPDRFGLLLRNAGAVGDIRDCPANCGKKVQIRRTLLNVPDVVSIGLVWGSDRPDMELTTEVAQTIGTTLQMPDIFHSVMCKDVNKMPRLYLSAMVCYYGKHYSTFVWHTKLETWVYFDDATVKEIGPRWEHVVDKCVRGRYQPLLLIYSNPAAAPVTTETAPSSRVMAPGYSVNGTEEPACNRPEVARQPEGGKLRSVMPIQEGGDPKATDNRKTATCTSNPDSNKGTEPLGRKSSFEHRRQSSFLIAVSSKPSVTARNNGGQSAENANYVNGGMPSLKEASYSEGVSRNNSVKSASGSVYQGENGSSSPDSGQDMPDSYNYTLSTSDQYRRPGLSSPDPTNLPITFNFSRASASDVQRKESFKKGKGKVPADVIRFQKNPSRRPSQSSMSDSDPNSSPVYPEGPGPEPVSQNEQPLPSQQQGIPRSQSFDDNQNGHLADTTSNPYKVIKPKPSNPGMYENVEEIGRSHTPVQSGLATLPRKKKGVSGQSSSVSQNDTKQGTRSDEMKSRRTSIKDGVPSMAATSQYCNFPPPVSSMSPQMAGSSEPYQSLTGYQGLPGESDMHSRQSSSSSILSQSTVVECLPQSENPTSDTGRHSRQLSSVSQDGSTEKPKETKSKSSKRKEEKRSKGKKEKSSGKPPAGPEKKPTDEGFSEDRFYIDRKMVESVLSFQKLQRSGSVVSQASTSSVESDNSYLKGRMVTPKDNLSVETFDTVSLESHKDSGYGSSDRNSSSSTGSVTLNPYEQYFMSRSMIPPKNLNPHAVAENMRKLMDQGYTQEKDLKSLVTNPSESYPQAYTVQHCQPVLQASDPARPPSQGSQSQQPASKNLMSLPKDERNQQIYDALKNRAKPVPPPQVPTKYSQNQQQQNQNQQQLNCQNGNFPPQTVPPKPGYPGCDARNTHPASRNGPGNTTPRLATGPSTGPQQGNQVSPSTSGIAPYMDYGVTAIHQGETSPTAIAGGNEQFLGACHKAEDFMDQCVLAETSEDYGQALQYCQQAIDILKGAIRLPNISQQSYDFVNRKSNSCLLKSRSLQKRLMTRQESNTSSNSSDNGSNHDYRNSKGPAAAKGQSSRPPYPQHLQVPHPGVRPPSRSSSQTSMDSIKDGSTGSSSGRSGTPVFDNKLQSRPPTDHNNRDRSFETNCGEPTNSADLYGTVPRRQTQKSQEHTRSSNHQSRESEVYQNFLDKQKQMCVGPSIQHSRSSSGAHTPVNVPENCTPGNGRQEYSSDQSMRQKLSTETVKTGHAEVRYISQPSAAGQQSMPPTSGTSYSTQNSGPQTPPQSAGQMTAPAHRRTEVGTVARSAPAPPVKPTWLQQPAGGQKGKVAHDNQGRHHGNVVVSKLPAKSSAIQTAYSASLQSVHSGQCIPVPSSSSSQGRPGCSTPHRPWPIERSASFSHAKPSHPAYLPLHCSKPASRGCSLGASAVGRSALTGRNGASQPDLRNLYTEDSGPAERPHTPQILCSNDSSAEADFRPSVRALASRFEGTNGSRTESPSVINTTSAVTVTEPCRNSSSVSLQRQRSKSESEFLAPKPKPKSVLTKKGKKCSNSKSRKSVTFSNNICLVELASGGWSDDAADRDVPDIPGGYQSDEEDRMELHVSASAPYLHHNVEEGDDSSASADSPVEVTPGEGACSLCHKKGVENGHSYCDKCEFYMSRFMTTR